MNLWPRRWAPMQGSPFIIAWMLVRGNMVYGIFFGLNLILIYKYMKCYTC